MVEISENVLRGAATLIAVLLAVVAYLFTRSGNVPEQGKKMYHEDVSKSLRAEHAASSASQPLHGNEKILSPSEFRPFSVLKTTRVSRNVKLISFELPPGRSLGLSLGRHVTLRAEIDGQRVMRAYTPTTALHQTGHFQLLVKAYEFGKMSAHLFALKPGQTVEVRGPVGRFHYEPNTHAHIGLVAGGTGLTPCLQLMRNVLEGAEFQRDTTRFTLFFQNRSEEDILLWDELREIAKKYADRVEIVFFLSNADENSASYGATPSERRGYVSRDALAEKMSPSQCSLVCLCGPSGFNDCVKNHLLAIGHDEKSVFVW